jgi:secreted trypsin-like serine protease
MFHASWIEKKVLQFLSGVVSIQFFESPTKMLKILFLLVGIGLNSSNCENTDELGSSNSKFIYGGAEVKPHSIPYQVYILTLYGTKALECGGSIISRNFILTAAHCLKE